MNIIVVGVGALGSHFMLFSRNFNVNFTIIDFDRIEQKNILSQFHTKMGVRQLKTVALSKLFNGLFGIKMKSISNKLTKDNVDILLKDADLVVDCLDNATSRLLIQNYVRSNNINCIHSALAPNGEFGRVIWDELFEIDSEVGISNATCEDGEHLPFIARASACLSEAVSQFITSGKKINYQITPSGSMRF